MKPARKPAYLPPALLSVLPFLLLLAFVRLPGAGGTPPPSGPGPVRILASTFSDATSARRVRSPVLYALPSTLGFSAPALTESAPLLNLIPDRPAMEPLPALIPPPALPAVGTTKVFNRTEEYRRRLADPAVFLVDRPRPASSPVTAFKGSGFTLAFNHGLSATHFPGASLAGLGEKMAASAQAWRLDATVRIEPPGLVTSVLCVTEDGLAPGVAEAVSRAIRAWRPVPVSAPLEGVVSILYSPPKTPARTLPAPP